MYNSCLKFQPTKEKKNLDKANTMKEIKIQKLCINICYKKLRGNYTMFGHVKEPYHHIVFQDLLTNLKVLLFCE